MLKFDKSKRKRFFKYLLKFLAVLHIILFLTGLILCFRIWKKNPGNSALMLYRKHYQDVTPVKIIPVALDEIPETVRNMLIWVEDPGFYSHHGIHLGAMLNALKLNIQHGYIKWGGSTITQQITRTLFLVPDKRYLRKYIEIIFALAMEAALSKERILELYFNFVEFGPGVYGIGRASIHHYGKEFEKLSLDEIMRLITILPNPVKYNTFDFSGNRHLTKRYYMLLNKFKDFEYGE
jgi:monofunctional biosynthetic peptidoglycan transglycosylase